MLVVALDSELSRSASDAAEGSVGMGYRVDFPDVTLHRNMPCRHALRVGVVIPTQSPRQLATPIMARSNTFITIQGARTTSIGWWGVGYLGTAPSIR